MKQRHPLGMERRMAAKKSNRWNATLNQKDADEHRRAASRFVKEATTSKKRAQETLKSMGIYTASGRLSRKYG